MGSQNFEGCGSSRLFYCWGGAPEPSFTAFPARRTLRYTSPADKLSLSFACQQLACLWNGKTVNHESQQSCAKGRLARQPPLTSPREFWKALQRQTPAGTTRYPLHDIPRDASDGLATRSHMSTARIFFQSSISGHSPPQYPFVGLALFRTPVEPSTYSTEIPTWRKPLQF